MAPICKPSYLLFSFRLVAPYNTGNNDCGGCMLLEIGRVKKYVVFKGRQLYQASL